VPGSGWIQGTGAATILGAVITAAWRPWSDEAKLRRKQSKISDLFVVGDPGTKGLINEVLPAPERMLAVETLCDQYGKDISLLKKSDYDHGEAIEAVKRGIENLTREFVTYKRENERNGGNGPGIGDSLSRIETALGIQADVTLHDGKKP
jgi:hypothetical protein